MSAAESASAKRQKMSVAKSWVEVAADSPFPIQNLPYGVFSHGGSPGRCGVAIGAFVLDLSALHAAGLFAGFDAACFAEAGLNGFMGLGKASWSAARATLTALLLEGGVDARLSSNAALRSAALLPQSECTMMLPASIGDYTDFYSSREHATNVGVMFRPTEAPLKPNWLHLPVGYHGRASSVVVSGTPIRRPCGQLQKDAKDATQGSVYGKCRLMDFELEMGFFIGKGNKMGEPIDIEDANDHLFGAVLLNDWSARDIQKFEYIPLGPFGGKNLGTSISPWVVTIDALEPFTAPTSAKVQSDPVPLAYLQEGENYASYDIKLQVAIQGEGMDAPFVVSRSNYRNMYWTHRQQLTHHTVTGCNMQPGDLIGSGTISGLEQGSFGSLLELCWKGTKPIEFPGGVQRRFLQDGDNCIMSGTCEHPDGYQIGFGTVEGVILPAVPSKYHPEV